MSGRKQDCVWLYFDKTKVVGIAICQAICCKKCGKEMQELVARINKSDFKIFLKIVFFPTLVISFSIMDMVIFVIKEVQS